jgi:hypothetical protein
MALYQPLTESFREINRLMIDQQRFNADLRGREQKFAIQSRLQEEQMKDRLLQRELVQNQVDEMRRMNTPTDFSLYSIAPNTKENQRHLFGNQNAMNEIASVLDVEGVGLQFSRADGTFRTADGGEYQVSPNQIARLAPAITGIVDARVDGMALAADRLVNLQEQRQQLSKGFTDPKGTRGGDFITKMRNADRKKKIARLDGQILNAQQQLTPAKQLEYYRNLKNKQAQRANWAAAQGHKDLNTYFTKAMGDAADLEKVALNKFLGSGTGKKGSFTQRLAYKPGSTTLAVNVPNDAPGSVTPQMFGSPAGYSFSKQDDGTGGSGIPEKRQFEKQVAYEIHNHYGKWNDDLSQWVMTDDEQRRHDYAMRIAKKQVKAEDAQERGLIDIYTTSVDEQRAFDAMLSVRFQEVAASGLSTEEKLDQIIKDVKAAQKESGYSREIIEELMGITVEIKVEMAIREQQGK